MERGAQTFSHVKSSECVCVRKAKRIQGKNKAKNRKRETDRVMFLIQIHASALMPGILTHHNTITDA